MHGKVQSKTVNRKKSAEVIVPVETQGRTEQFEVAEYEAKTGQS